MAKRGIISQAVATVKSVVQEAAAAAVETPSAGKPSLADLGVPVPALKTSRKKASKRKASKSESKSTRKAVRKKGKKRRR